MRHDNAENGMFSWNELLTTDLESAKEFYGELLGWSFQETETISGEPYIIAKQGESMVGGMMLKPAELDEEIEPCWDPYISVEDVELSAIQVEKLGGTLIQPPTEIPLIGKFCVIRDRQGVYLNLISYG